ncbi:MAG TPA: hypothetical protein VFX03_17005 [Thermomicrobiales bacterium]|nr:hypothetical protein [Thermomicrobiales bacterium]
MQINRRRAIGGSVAFALGASALPFVTAGGQAEAQDATPEPNRTGNPVMSVTKFNVPAGELANFMELTRRANGVHEQYGSAAKVRVWVDNLAGPDTGLVIHTKEYPSFEAMAADYTLVHPTPEWQQFLQDFDAAGVEVVSNSLQWELVP